MPNGGVCDLVAVNMTDYVDDDAIIRCNNIVRDNILAYVLAESILSATYLPLEEMKVSCNMYHNIGVGIMGFADMLIMRNTVYGSKDSFYLIKNIMEDTKNCLNEASILAGKRLGNYHLIDGTEGNRRNAMLNTVAPTGTISMFADVSSGIEPIFSVAYEKEANGEMITIVNKQFKKMLLKEFDEQKANELIEKCKNLESIQHITEIPEHIRKLFVTNIDIHPAKQIDVVCWMQRYIDAGISKTIILPNDFPFETMRDLMEVAHGGGCKGITVYRNGTREAPIKLKKDNGNEYVLDMYNDACDYDGMTDKDSYGNERSMSSNICPGINVRQRTGCGHLTVNVASDVNMDSYLLKCYIANSGGCKSNLEALGRSLYIAARYMTPKQRRGYYDELIKAFSNIKCDSCKRNPKSEVKSCPHGIANSIKTMLEMIDNNALCIDYNSFKEISDKNKLKLYRVNEQAVKHEPEMKQGTLERRKCPECGNVNNTAGKCFTCQYCGYSSCVDTKERCGCYRRCNLRLHL